MRPGARWLLALTLPLLLVDYLTKRLALSRLQPPHTPHEVIGDVVRLTLTFNRGGAMGTSLGPWSRWGYALLAVAMGIALIVLLLRSRRSQIRYAVALALILGGAVGNLIDRIRWERGVVDFIDIGFGAYRFWTFNVADMGVSLGAALLAWVLWREGRAPPSN